MSTQVEKITISLPRDLVLFTDKLAKERKISRSRVVSLCLREHADLMLREQMEEGYKAMSKENQQFADAALKVAGEVLPDWE